MSGTSKKHVFPVKWKMFPHVPPTCSQRSPNTLLVVLGVLNEQCVGEHLCVPGYKTRVHMFSNNDLYPNSCFHSVAHCQSAKSYRWGFAPPFLPFSPQASSPFVMPCPPPGFNATQYLLVVAEEAKLAVGKKYCYQKKSAWCTARSQRFVCPLLSVFMGFFAHYPPSHFVCAE